MSLWIGALIILALGAFTPLLLLWRAGLLAINRPHVIAGAVGAALLVLILVVQPLLYTLPARLGVFLGGWTLFAYVALVSGLLQEGFKLGVVTKGFRRQAASLGYGFGVGEILLVVLPTLLIVGRLGGEVPLAAAGAASVSAYALSGWERLNVTLFHSFTAVLLARPRPRPLARWLGLGLLHAGVNFSGLAAMRYYGVVEPDPLLLFYAAFTLLNLLLARLALSGGKLG